MCEQYVWYHFSSGGVKKNEQVSVTVQSSGEEAISSPSGHW